jgi:hypothetical protein
MTHVTCYLNLNVKMNGSAVFKIVVATVLVVWFYLQL